MATNTANGLHLPSLSISGFRDIRHLRIPRLGHVTLLVGKNGSGKTTVLQAIRAHAARGKNLADAPVANCRFLGPGVASIEQLDDLGNDHMLARAEDQAEKALAVIALAMADASDGFLLLDEIANGLHYSVHYDLWRTILQGARENNVQVVATTHSSSCVRGLAAAGTESKSIDCILVRLERETDETRVVTYDQDELEIVAEQGIEVR